MPDRLNADKWLSPERIKELEEERQRRKQEEQEQPVQITLSDYNDELFNKLKGLA